MKPLDGTPWPHLNFSDLRKKRDLVYFDGPLVSHFENKFGEDFLLYWVDCDDEANRWMVIRLDEASILRLENRVVPLNFVIPGLCRDPFVVFIDIPDSQTPRQPLLVPLNKIPADYLPKEGAYLPASPVRKTERSYSVLIEGGWSVNELGKFPHLFTKVYSLLYGLNVLHVPNLPGFPWRGGFSSMHFFNEAWQRIPAEDRPRVSAIQYASPGFMRFALHGATADEVGVCLENYRHNKELTAAWGEATAYIREHRLNDVEDESSDVWVGHDERLKQLTLKLLRGFEVIDEEAFVRACERPFEAAKIAMTFYRYIRDLVEFEKRRLVIFPRVPERSKSSAPAPIDL